MARKEKKYHFIYKTTNILNGRYYYGMHSTNDLEDGYLGSGDRLRRSVNKHGQENHVREILEFCKDREILSEREGEIVNLNEIAKKNCMNLIVGGIGFTQEQRRKGRINANKVINERLANDIEFRNYWRKQTSKGLQKFYENGGTNGWMGRKHTEETKEKMRISGKGKHIGNKNSQYGTCWINNSIIEKKIKKENLDEYLSQGWNKGRILTSPDLYRT
jgi:hypothetical protein